MIADLKPYPACTESGVPWLGLVPDHWEIQRLKQVTRLAYGDALPSGTRQTGGVSVFGSNGRVGVHAVANTHAPCVVVGRKGSFGKINYSAVPVFAIDTTFYIDDRQTKASIRYLFYLLGTLGLDKSSKDSAVPGLDRGDAYQCVIAYPQDTVEQSTIVRFLDHADRRIRRYIAAKQKLIGLLNEQKQAIINRAATRGIDPDVRQKPSGIRWIGSIPEHWDLRRAKYYFSEIDRRSDTGDEELLSVSHITGVTPRSEKNITMFMAESYEGYKTCQPGDLVINIMWAWMGALGVSEYAGIVSSSYGVFRQRKQGYFENKYLDYLLRTHQYVSEFTCRSTGIRSSRLRMYSDDFLDTCIIRPPIEEQKRIVARIEASTGRINQAIAKSEREIELLYQLRTRLIADVVTGKVDVRGIPVEAITDWGETEELEIVEEIEDEIQLEDDRVAHD